LQVRVLPGPPAISKACGVRDRAPLVTPNETQPFPRLVQRAVANRTRRCAQIIGKVVAIKRAQESLRLSLKIRRPPIFVDAGLLEPGRSRMSQRMGGHVSFEGGHGLIRECPKLTRRVQNLLEAYHQIGGWICGIGWSRPCNRFLAHCKVIDQLNFSRLFWGNKKAPQGDGIAALV
jgi:hypothetical protein